jgi:metal-responsive CopG/Arc/MetJ family transcriptional regulator
MNKKRLSTLEHTDQVKITLTSDQIKYIDKQCKKRFNMVNRSHMIRQLIIDSIEKENTIKDIKEEDNENYLSFEEYSLIHSVLSDSLKAITEKEKVTEVLKKLYYISILDYKQLNIFENS